MAWLMAHQLQVRPSHILSLRSLCTNRPPSGDAKKKKKKKKPKKKVNKVGVQSDPPRVGLSKLFPNGVYPEGEIQEYQDECVAFHTLR